MGEDSVIPGDLMVVGNSFSVKNRYHFLRIIKDFERDGKCLT